MLQFTNEQKYMESEQTRQEKLKKQRAMCNNTKKEYRLLYIIIQKNTEGTISS